jgi:hypothetical protein
VQALTRCLEQVILGIEAGSLGPNTFGVGMSAELPQHFPQMRRDIAAPIVRISGA